jgi:hypothetical protein
MFFFLPSSGVEVEHRYRIRMNDMRYSNSSASLLIFIIAAILPISAQTAANSKPEPDVLLLTDGEKLIGQLENATGKSVIFKSNPVGELTVEWSKIQELHSSEKFAAIPKDEKLRSGESTANVARGTVAVTNQQLQVESGDNAPRTMPTSNLGTLVEEDSFDKAFRRTSFLQGWKGGATVGLSLTEATQKNQSFTAALNLTRSVPAESWLDLRSRTVFDYDQAYDKLTQPGSPDVKTSLYHVDAEQDWYLSPRLFAFGQAIFDHSFSQGLDLQQTYGGGLGFVVFKTPAQEYDVKASSD